MDSLGLTDWKIAFRWYRHPLGRCVWERRTVELSRWHVYFGRRRHVLDTVRHEACHIVSNTDDHGQKFQVAAALLGVDGL